MKIPSRRIALGIQYDGSRYEGWQSQPHGNTVQDHLERALQVFIGDSLQDSFIRVNVAGRTDTGVHALGQVVHFDVAIDRPDWSWVRVLILTYLRIFQFIGRKKFPKILTRDFQLRKGLMLIMSLAHHIPYPC